MSRFSPVPALLTLTLTLAAVACGGAANREAKSPRGAGRGWSETATDHFTLRTDLDPSDAAAAATKLEASYAALAELAFASSDRPTTTIDVVYFKRHEDYATVRPQGTAGEFFPDGIHDFERRPTAVVSGDFTESAQRTLQHELTHMFVHYYYPHAPTWLNEGLARYFETLVVEDGRAILGRAPREARFWKGPWKRVSDKWWAASTLIPMEEAPTVSALRAMSATFYVDRDADARTSQGRESLRAMAVHYQAAWCLVHLLLLDETYAKVFGEYLARLHAGERDEVAWPATLGRLPAEPLESKFRASLVPAEVTTLRTEFTPPAIDAPHPRPMDDREVRVLWARLRDWSDPSARDAAANELSALEGETLSVEEATTLADWLVAQHRTTKAKEVLAAAVASHARHPQLVNAQGWILLGELAGRARTHAPEDHEADAQLDDVARELRTKASSAPELDLAGRILALSGRTDDALAFEQRALHRDPSCGMCLVVAADLLAQKGRYREALDAAHALRPDAPVPPKLAASIETWRRLAASEGAAPPANASSEAVAVPHADAVLASLRPKLRVCFGGEAHPPAGSVELDVQVAADGSVRRAVARSGATFAASVVDCLAGVLTKAHFPAPGADAALRVPIAIGGP